MENFVSITGNLVRDPETRVTPGGDQVTTFRIAINRRVRNSDGTGWETRNDGFHDVCVWRQLAETAHSRLRKGQRVVVQGRLIQKDYILQGDRRSKIEIEADEIAVSLRYEGRGAAQPVGQVAATASSPTAPAAEAERPW